MAFNLLNLIGQQMGVMSPMPEEAPTEDIVVTAPQERPTAERMLYNEAPPRPAVDPRYVLNDDRIAPNRDEMREILPRQGMFGVKGTLRDVLGTLGDAFLTQAGRDTVYRPQRLREQMGDAMFGAADDPYQAAERLAAAGFTKEAQDLLQQSDQARYQAGMLESTNANRQDQANNRAFDNLEQGWNRVARWVAGGMPYERVVAGASNYGISADDLAKMGVTAEMSEEERNQFGSMDMTTNQIRNIPFTERRVATSEKNADTARIAATRPRNPPPRPRSDTVQEMFEEIGRIDPEDREAWQNDFYRRYMEGTDGNESLISAPPPPPSSNPRFRPVR